MAISINDQYPGKTAGVNADYPQGQARNITTPGDGTGTPWEAAIVNDDQGFKQAILAEAGVAPSGTPDTAVDSQYLDALKTIVAGMISDALPDQRVAGWVRFGFVSGSLTVFASSGIAGVTRLSAGKYRVAFSEAIPSAAYAVTGNAQQPYSTEDRYANILVPMAYATTYVDVWTFDNNRDSVFETSNANVVIYK